jgi:GT2 family glycosyltransferase
LRGATVVASDRNLGFGVGNDLAALHARGEVLCLLNSDAIVPPGWLDGLLAGLDRHADAGAVVPLYLSPDGTVGEAGCAVEPDGRVVALDVGADPEAAALRFPRRVQYGSAACMLLRRSDFAAVGGFDPGFAPAYYEDVDLAFRLAERGRTVWLEPSVQVVHAQGASSLTHADAVALRDANRERFRRRWAHRLWGRPLLVDLEREPHRHYAARDWEAPERILLVASNPDERACELARATSREHPGALVTFLATGTSDLPREADQLLDAGIECCSAEHPGSWLEARRFHYSDVIGAAELIRRLSDVLDETQPQAARAHHDVPSPPSTT